MNDDAADPQPGRVTMVTGAASGIGAATARRLAADGARVWLGDVQLDRAEQVAQEIRETGGDAAAVAIDVAREESVRAAFATVAEQSAAIDVLVLSAGVMAIAPFEELTVDAWERTLRINVIGTYLCLRTALPLLRAAPVPARAIVLASASAKRPGPFTAPYNASKSAVMSIVRTAASAWAPDVLVNAVSPGVIDTPMWARMDAELAELGAGPGTSFAERTAALPIRRAGTAEEVAETVAFVAGPGGRYLVGEEINVNGGLTLA